MKNEGLVIIKSRECGMLFLIESSQWKPEYEIIFDILSLYEAVVIFMN